MAPSRQQWLAGTGSQCCQHPTGRQSPVLLTLGSPNLDPLMDPCPVNKVCAGAVSSASRQPTRKLTYLAIGLTWNLGITEVQPLPSEGVQVWSLST